jgi:HlyD family secretion protein
MKKLIPVLIIALAVAGFFTRNYWLPQGANVANYLGYVEGDTVMIASPVAGRIVARVAEQGHSIAKGSPVFELDSATAKAELARAEAAVAQARAQLDNLRAGKREPEQEVTRAQRREAEASLAFAKQELIRATELSTTGTASKLRLDQAVAQVQQWQARVEQFAAAEAVGNLGGRAQEIAAAEAGVAEAKAVAAQASARLADLSPLAPFDCLVENTFYDVGEWVAAGQPVVSLLAPDHIKIRFFVPEGAAALARPGTEVSFTCDACKAEMRAVITYAATQAEFTPPVIYSQGARAKLVFLVEARPLGDAAELRPGLPVEVMPLAGKGS